MDCIGGWCGGFAGVLPGTFLRLSRAVTTFVTCAAAHGHVWVNGSIWGGLGGGPSRRCICRKLLRERNELCILEMLPDHAPWAAFRATPALVGNLTDKPVHDYRAEE